MRRPRTTPVTTRSTTLCLLAGLLACLATSVAAYTPLSDSFLRLVPGPDSSDFDIKSGGLLAPILIPRVPGTPGQTVAQEHFVSFFRRELPKWNISWQNSTGTTPVTGDRKLPFQNLIIRREPPWTKPGQANLLTLVAHYDSKITPKGFIGATDSAAPCAVLMHVARRIDEYMTKMHGEMAANGEKGGRSDTDMGVQILFLDGEEAFMNWSDTDSLYGARSLSEEWERTPNPAMAPYQNPMRQISLFVLLDLLGEQNPRVPSYFMTTHWAYKRMATVESRLRSLGLLETKSKTPFLNEPNKQPSQFGPAFVEDDHVPFMARGAPTLHLIPSPFPNVWHTMQDDGEHLDIPTVKDWARIVTAFTLEWLDMMEVEPTAPPA